MATIYTKNVRQIKGVQIMTEKTAKIKIIGVGGAGISTVNRMIKNGLTGVEFWVMNTDVQLLDTSDCKNKLQLGKNTTNGLGSGGNPQIGEKSAKETEQDIKMALNDADMVFITAGMGSGTGTGAAPVIAKMAKDMGILTIAVVSRPFSWEGQEKQETANQGIKGLRKSADAVLVIPNDKLLQGVDRQVSMAEAFQIVDETLLKFVQTISDMITIPGRINVDFADVKTVMQNAGFLLMSIGQAAGENRAIEAVKKAIRSESLESPLKDATSVIVNIKGGADMCLHDISDVANVIQDAVSDDTTVIIGTVIDESIQDEVQITVVAMGLDTEK